MCCPDKPSSPVPVLLLIAAVAAVAFWPAVVMVAHTVAMIVKAALIAGLIAVAAGAAVAIGVKLRRHHWQAATASVVTVASAQPSVHDRLVGEQIAALTVAVNRLADEARPVLPAPVSDRLPEQQLEALLVGLSRLAAERTGEPRRLEVAERWDVR